jgi:hypothetical protein
VTYAKWKTNFREKEIKRDGLRFWKTASVLIPVPIFMSTITMPLQNSDMDIQDMKIGTRINTETVFQGPKIVFLDLLSQRKFRFQAPK